MVERSFVDALILTITKHWEGAVVQRSSDRYTLGVPDVLGWVNGGSLAIEAKQLHPLMPDPFHRGRRTGQMLKHPFMGPQISMLRRLEAVGVEAFGLVRASLDTAFRIHPRDLPTKTGNFTYEELVKIGRPIYKKEALWRFWENDHADEIPGSGYRDDPRD